MFTKRLAPVANTIDQEATDTNLRGSQRSNQEKDAAHKPDGDAAHADGDIDRHVVPHAGVHHHLLRPRPHRQPDVLRRLHPTPASVLNPSGRYNRIAAKRSWRLRLHAVWVSDTWNLLNEGQRIDNELPACDKTPNFMLRKQ